MMEQRKTEPWKIGAMESGMVAIDSNDGEEVTGFIDPEYASRILACVNACAGFSNDELDGANLHKDSIDAQNEIDDLRADLATAEQDSRQKQARIDRIERERDELLAAAVAAKPALELYKAYGWPDRAGVIHKLSNAILSKGGAE